MIYIYKIPFVKSDKLFLLNNLFLRVPLNFYGQQSLGLYFLLLIIKKDYGFNDSIFMFNENGKPFINGINFNISYSENFIYIAISKKQNISIDAERKKSINIKTCNIFMSEDEIIKINKIKNKDMYFLKIWTMKEAYLKLLGTGLTDDIKKIEFKKDGNFFKLKNEINKNIILLNIKSKDNIISLASFNDINYKFYTFNTHCSFLKKYDKYSK